MEDPGKRGPFIPDPRLRSMLCADTYPQSLKSAMSFTSFVKVPPKHNVPQLSGISHQLPLSRIHFAGLAASMALDG